MHSFKLTKNVIGLDLGSHSLKIAECQRAGDKVALLKYAIKKWPTPRNPNQPLSRQEVSLFIRQTLNELGIHASEAASEVTGPWTVARHLIMPDLADDEMREAIRWGAKSEFPFSLDDAVIGFHKFEVLKKQEGEKEAEKEAKIVVGVATREVVDERVALLKDGGLKPLFLSLSAFDLMQAYRLIQPPPPPETAAFIDLGFKSTRIIVVKDGNLKFSREIAVAGDAFTQSLVGSYEINGQIKVIDEGLAERIKIKSTLLEEGGFDPEALVEGIPLGQVQKRLRSVMDRLTLEVERSLTYYKNQFNDYEIQRIFLTGGGSLLQGLPALLEKNLDLSVLNFQGRGSIALKKKISEDLYLKDVPFLTTVLSLVSQTRPLINLSQTYIIPQDKKTGPGKYVKILLAAALLAGLFMIFGMPYWTARRQADALQKELIVKKGQLDRLGKATEELTRLEQEEALLNKVLEGIPPIQAQPIPVKNLLQELSRLMPANMTLTRFQCSSLQDSGTGAEGKTVPAKPETGSQKSGETGGAGGKEENRKEFFLVIQGLVFGSDQEILATLKDFTDHLNGSLYFKQAKVQMTLKVKDFNKSAAEFKVLAKLGDGPQTTAGVSS